MRRKLSKCSTLQVAVVMLVACTILFIQFNINGSMFGSFSKHDDQRGESEVEKVEIVEVDAVPSSMGDQDSEFELPRTRISKFNEISEFDDQNLESDAGGVALDDPAAQINETVERLLTAEQDYSSDLETPRDDTPFQYWQTASEQAEEETDT